MLVNDNKEFHPPRSWHLHMQWEPVGVAVLFIAVSAWPIGQNSSPACASHAACALPAGNVVRHERRVPPTYTPNHVHGRRPFVYCVAP